MENIQWERVAAIFLSVTLGSVALYLLLRYAFPVLLPFLIAYLVSLMIRPIAKKLSRILHLPRKLIACLLLLFLILGGAYLLWTLLTRLISEAVALLEQLLTGGVFSATLESVQNWFASVSERFGINFLANREELDKALVELLRTSLTSLASSLPDIITALVSSLPSFFLLVVITLVAGFYLCMDGEHITQSTLELLPSALQKKLFSVRMAFKSIFKRYLKAYLYLFLLTFLLLYVGLLILGVEYALLLAFLIALADLLPIIGVGTVMLPWGILLLLQKNFYVGFGLLILYLAISLVRQIAEPRFIGKSLGLHPLATLLASYAGLTLFGFFGMLLAPIALSLVKGIYSSVFVEQSKNPKENNA